MLHVILLILKILGIILLIIAGLLLLILWSVLFVAASYRVHIEKQDALKVTARAGWLFRTVTVHFSLNCSDGWKRKLQLRLFGFPIWDPYAEKKPKKKRRKRRRKEKESKAELESKAEPETKAQVPPKTLEDSPEQPVPEPEPEASDNAPRPVQHTESGHESGRKTGEKSSGRKSFFRKKIYAIKGICDKIKHMGRQILGIRDKVRSLLEKKDSFLEFWNLEEHRHAREAVFRELRYLWKKYRPGKIEGRLTFGFEDPALTGLCMGGIGMLCAWYPDSLQITPDFEQVILEGDIQIKGKVRFYVLARILWRVYFNRDIRHMYEHWKQL